ncbi:MAG: type II toxin-antitoxin system RelE/ParE family toxin [Bacteroidetes bacterium]|nr:type II toxin-antitoxin system RelE/ParE family toxin [Bacteroidota bacterium]MBU1580553.1 type II toxin-antitoxin system RelE/ParE family toxin [Bacteroidota bacterium]MBU2465809.1 type II toxin-antitoxin system RelE/ParE family toxin [Bacteroidota bacterium]MBU2557425.1 type II toxin-antitoxin system RelE/ParE family toxin [Bacteroidota bacterium]
MVRINWTFQAKDDLKSIAEYISRDSRKYAKLQVLRIKNRTDLLKSQTYLGKIVSEIDKENIRELIEGRYRVIYKIVSEKQIDILTIHHTARVLTRRTIK